MSRLDPEHARLAGLAQSGFDAALQGLTLVSAEDGQALLTLPVGPAVVNVVGTLHGGAIATLVDVAGTLAIISADRDQRPGVTTDLNVSYFAAAAPPGTVRAEARVLRAGRTLAFVEVDLREGPGEGGKLLAQGRMTKFMGQPGPTR